MSRGWLVFGFKGQLMVGATVSSLAGVVGALAGVTALSGVEGAPGWALPTLAVAAIGAVVLPFAWAGWFAARVGASWRELAGLMRAAADGDLTGRTEAARRGPCAGLAEDYDHLAARLGHELGTIGDDVLALSAAMEELSVATSEISGGVAESSREAGSVAASAQQVSTSAQAVATATEQMSASIREIASSTSAGAAEASQAVEAVETASATVSQLGESSAQIGEVVKLITQIAEQTNLLALNATIEAARAGEAGKGFAVVASEVKDLAQETARATEDIGGRIEAIQTDVGAAATAIGRITTVIDHVSESQGAVATALDEQTSVTEEMSRSVTEAAAGAEAIAESINRIADAASTSSEAVTDTTAAQADAARMTGGLTELLARFRYVADDGDVAVERQITRAIGAHGAWKKRLRSAVDAGRHQEDVALVGRDDRCAFGRWLGESGGQDSTGNHAVAKEQHAAFHRAAAEVLRMLDAGRRADAEASLEPGGSFAEASRVLTATMMGWRRQVS
ncbi:methyl-accepting chemotaxis protein [Demequina zhanjiangensis]|uniref:Methyl-accepting chemotaxis protein n=1 Tax=Demequina zhanjiangensis TaxID=3051659 RepID=A0ABT8G1I5_9MICO|nr:methyl-accepting chemotaxis protein [Demequina sp. SYSU T00b26]MDN4472953.1 methyl-accepting chemotaxis protein [Demequina sp. SYSU T00b26]